MEINVNLEHIIEVVSVGGLYFIRLIALKIIYANQITNEEDDDDDDDDNYIQWVRHILNYFHGMMNSNINCLDK